MSGSNKPHIRLVASNIHGRSPDKPGKDLPPELIPGDGSSDDTRPERSNSRASSSSLGSGSGSGSSSSSISSDDESVQVQGTDARDSARTPSFYKSAQWTADGTTVITSSYYNQICSFVIPSDLLEPRNQPLTIHPQGVLNLATPTNVFAPAPYFDLLNPQTHHVLVACRDHPIQIFQALPTNHSVNEPPDNAPHSSSEGAPPLYSYNLISPQTEAYLPVHSLVWPASSASFFVGSTNLIAQFDLQRIGEGPQQRIQTIPSKRHISKGNGVGMRGTVSALSMQNDQNYVPTGLLAAGTWTRWVGLYDFARGGERTATWSIAEAARSVVLEDPPPGSGLAPTPTRRHTSRRLAPLEGIGGEGITQAAWSPDGRYLLLNERQSTGVLIYDVRVTNKVLGFLAGRDALTHQRLDLTVYPESGGMGGFEVWAGTRDGTVKVWQGVGHAEGCLWPSWDFPTMDGDGNHENDDGENDKEKRPTGFPVGSVALHASGSVAATCTGCWSVASGDDDSAASSSSSSSSSSDDGSDDDGASDSTLSSAGSKLNRSFWRPDNKRIEESSLQLWIIGGATYDDAEHERESISQTEGTEMDVSQVNMPNMDDAQMSTSPAAAHEDQSHQDTSLMDTLQTGSTKTLDIRQFGSQLETMEGEETNAVQDDPQNHTSHMDTS